MQECLEGAAEFEGQVFVADRTEQGNGGGVGLQLGDASGTFGQMLVECLVDFWWKLAFHIVRKESYEIPAALHGSMINEPWTMVNDQP
jgi:hypothetical protein